MTLRLRFGVSVGGMVKPQFGDTLHTSVDFHRNVDHPTLMNAGELKRWLAAQGCTFETKKGGSGHLIVKRGERKSELPMHGGGKELGTGLVNAIKKQLGLK
jgi:mRNA interferase HicA